MFGFNKKQKKALKFKSDSVERILAGQRNTTWRLFDDKNLTVGDQLSLVGSETKQEFARAEITQIKEKKLGAVTHDDFDTGHQEVGVPELVAHYKILYGKEVTPETVVKIITYKLLK